MWTKEDFERFFLSEVRPLESRYNGWVIPLNVDLRIRQFSVKVGPPRAKDYMKTGDTHDVEGRYYVGIAGEQAVHYHLGLGGDSLDISIDYTLNGNRNYHHNDLRPFGANVGIKSAKYPYTPAINPSDFSERAQIICSVYPPTDSEELRVHVLGMIRTRQYRDGVDMDMKTETMGNKHKGGFRAYDKLGPVPSSIEELRKMFPWAPIPVKDQSLFDNCLNGVLSRGQDNKSR